jgi:MarC family membrane protein
MQVLQWRIGRSGIPIEGARGLTRGAPRPTPSLVNPLSYALLAFGSLFAILSPFATVPTFLALTEEQEATDRVATARRACLVALASMLAFALLGAHLLAALRISVPALQIAGGFVILRIAFRMLEGERRRLTAEERSEALGKNDAAITPLGVPLLCGPGAITTGILLHNEAAGALQVGLLVTMVVLVYGLTFGMFWVAVTYSKYLGPIALTVVGRLMGLLIAAIAIQFVIDGLGMALPSMLGEPVAAVGAALDRMWHS